MDIVWGDNSPSVEQGRPVGGDGHWLLVFECLLDILAQGWGDPAELYQWSLQLSRVSYLRHVMFCAKHVTKVTGYNMQLESVWGCEFSIATQGLLAMQAEFVGGMLPPILTLKVKWSSWVHDMGCVTWLTCHITQLHHSWHPIRLPQPSTPNTKTLNLEGSNWFS